MPAAKSLDVWMRCEPCPRPIPARRTLPDQDGAVYRHFRCDGNCMQASVHTCPPRPSPHPNANPNQSPLPGSHRADASPRGHQLGDANAFPRKREPIKVDASLPGHPPIDNNAFPRRRQAGDANAFPRERWPRNVDAYPNGYDSVGINASPRGHRVAIVPSALRSRDRAIERIVRAVVVALAVLAALATTFAVRRAAADTRKADTRARDPRAVADTRSMTANRHDPDDESEDDDDGAVDIASPSTREAPWLTGVDAPSVKDVLAAAYRTAGLDGDVGRGFARRARLAGLVPMVSVRTGRDSSWRDSDPDVARGMVIDVRATWRLDRLVFDGRELQAVSLEAARRRERRRLASQVIELYFRWKRAARASGGAEEAAAALDDLTAGWFSEEVGARAKMSESRTLR